MYFVPCGILLIAVLWVPAVMPYKTGAPVRACDEMKPSHKGNLPQGTPMPYLLTITAKSIDGRNFTQITLSSLNGEPFKGFLVKAVEFTNNAHLLGEFDVSNSDGLAKTLNCFDGQANAVTHVNPDPKLDVVVEWTAPRNFTGGVQFLYTVVKEYNTFWLNGKSQVLTVIAEDDPVTTTQQPIITTTPSKGGPCVFQVSVLWVVVTLVLVITSTKVSLYL